MRTIESSEERRPHFFTYAFILLCIALYLLINTLSGFGEIDESTYKLFGAPFAIEIYQGQFWGVILNSLIHVYWYQLLINLVLAFFFLRIIEEKLGLYKLFILGLLASTVTSCIQLAVSDDAGIGLSGVNFSLLGFLLVRKNIDPRFDQKWIYYAGIFMAFMFFVMLYMNQMKNWNFGLGAMIGGFLWGALVALMYFKRSFKLIAPLVVTSNLLCFMTLFYAPWSAEWNCAKGISWHKRKETEKAKSYYEKALIIDPENYLATENLKIIQINEWSEQAYNAHKEGYLEQARKLYRKILKEDPDNAWARSNLKEIE